MNQFDQFGEDDSGTVFRDTIMLALAGFVSVVVLLLPHINPKAKETDAGDKAPGNVIIEAQWTDGIDADVDLWVRAPGDRPVGYSNKAGNFFNLLRDDLGKPLDVTNLNYEVAYTRGLPAGDYVINLHLYRALAQTLPIDVQVVASLRATAQSESVPLVSDPCAAVQGRPGIDRHPLQAGRQGPAGARQRQQHLQAAAVGGVLIMDVVTPVFVVGVILISLLASVAIWAPRRIWVRCWAVALSAVVFVSGYAALTDMLSRPKPMSLAWAEGQVQAADVLGSTFIEGEAIYVWLRLPGLSRTALLQAALGPEAGAGTAGRDERGRPIGHGRGDAPALRSKPGRRRTAVLRHPPAADAREERLVGPGSGDLRAAGRRFERPVTGPRKITRAALEAGRRSARRPSALQSSRS